jgi:hypothetical protein
MRWRVSRGRRLMYVGGVLIIAGALGLVVWSLTGFHGDGPDWCPPGQFQSYGSGHCSPVPTDPADAGAGAPVGHEWRVGVNMAPGGYVTNDIDPAWGCYWERLSGPHGKPESIIETGFADPGSDVPVSVIIEPTDYKFYSEGCGDWHPGEGK